MKGNIAFDTIESTNKKKQYSNEDLNSPWGRGKKRSLAHEFVVLLYYGALLFLPTVEREREKGTAAQYHPPHKKEEEERHLTLII